MGKWRNDGDKSEQRLNGNIHGGKGKCSKKKVESWIASKDTKGERTDGDGSRRGYVVWCRRTGDKDSRTVKKKKFSERLAGHLG